MLFLAFSALLLKLSLSTAKLSSSTLHHCAIFPSQHVSKYFNFSNLPTQNDNFSLQSASIKFVLN